jgi:hypothetical protein
MLKKIKNYLPNRKLIFVFFCLFLLVVLFFPLNKAEAILGTGIFDYFNTALEGVEEGAGPLAGKVITVFFFYIIGIILLYTSANFLQLVLNESPKWLVIQNSALVQSGWHFVAGLANLFLILIFIVIAIAYILKIETFAAKKALPKLIIVALLLNFSLVFVGVLVDISRILFNTVLKGNETLITDFISVLGLDIKNIFTQLFSWLVLLVGLWVIPFIGPFSQLAFAILLLSGYFTNIITWIFQIITSFMISAVFFLYIFLFAARVFVIQLLAIISPFAFVCMILPQTQKWWDEWLKHLLQWTFLGIVLLFFLAIGLRAAHELVPPGGLTVTPSADVFFNWARISAIFTYYFFIFIYLILVGYVSNRFMPVLAAFIISQATAWGQRAKGLAKPFASVATTSARRVGKEKAAPWLRKQIGEERLKKWATAPLPGAEEKGVKGAFKRLVSAPTWGLRRGIGVAVGPAVIEAEVKEIEKGKGRAEALPTKEARFRGFQGATTRAERLQYIMAAIEKEEMSDWRKFGFSKQQAKQVFEEAKAVDKDKYAKPIARYFSDWLAKEWNPERWEEGERKIKEGEELIAKGQKRKGGRIKKSGEELQESVIEELMAGIKTADITKISEQSLTDPRVKRALIHTFRGEQMAEIGRSFGREFVLGIQKEIEKMKFGELVSRNPRLTYWLHTTGARNLGFKLPADVEGMPRKVLVDEIERSRIFIEEDRERFKKGLRMQGPILLRKVYRKETPPDIKEMIREIAIEQGKTIPPELVVKERIGKFEEEYDELTKEYHTLWENARKARSEVARLRRIGAPPTDIATARTAMREAQRLFREGKRRIDPRQRDLLRQEKDKLRDLW